LKPDKQNQRPEKFCQSLLADLDQAVRGSFGRKVVSKVGMAKAVMAIAEGDGYMQLDGYTPHPIAPWLQRHWY
jgi:hypothetical protein